MNRAHRLTPASADVRHPAFVDMPERLRIPRFTFGDRLRKAREDAGLDQRTIAETLGVTSATISHWETGVNQPRDLFALVEKWAEITRVDRNWLLTGVALRG